MTGKLIALHDILTAWQAGDIETAEALRLSGIETVADLYEAAVLSNVALKRVDAASIPLLRRLVEAEVMIRAGRTRDLRELLDKLERDLGSKAPWRRLHARYDVRVVS